MHVLRKACQICCSHSTCSTRLCKTCCEENSEDQVTTLQPLEEDTSRDAGEVGDDVNSTVSNSCSVNNNPFDDQSSNGHDGNNQHEWDRADDMNNSKVYEAESNGPNNNANPDLELHNDFMTSNNVYMSYDETKDNIF